DMFLDNGKMARKTFAYSSTENTQNPIDTWEYDYGDTSGSLGLLLRRRHIDYLTSYNSPTDGIYIRDLILSEKRYDAGGALAAQVDYSYDETPAIDAPGIVQYAAVGPQRGNRTKEKRWRNTDTAWLVTTFAYDVAGNII